MSAAVQPRILLVDDQPANPAVPDALRALRSDEFAAVMLAVRMPALEGVQTAELIRRQPGSEPAPILFLTEALEQALATAIGGRA